MGWKNWVNGVRLINQVKRDSSSGKITGFKVGGITNPGMRKQKITKFYHTALLLAGIPRQDIETFTFHGLRRTAVTMQMEYGDNLPEEEVMKATRHTSTRCFRLYNQESAQKQANECPPCTHP